MTNLLAQILMGFSQRTSTQSFGEPQAPVTLMFAGTSLLVSILALYYTHKDRWSRLQVRFVGGDYFQVQRTLIRGSVLIFNPSTRPNAIATVKLSVSDGESLFNLYSLPTLLTLPTDGEPRKANWVPLNIPVGFGVEAEMVGWDYKAFRLSRDCAFHVELVDTYGRTYKVSHTFANEWPKERYPNDVN